MIKLVVSDVDGTLLPIGSGKLDASVIGGISRVLDRGTAFAIASGRSYENLRALFGTLSEKIYFICHDGALCVKNGKAIYRRPIGTDDLSCFFSNAKSALADAVFSGESGAYAFGGSAKDRFEREGGARVRMISSVYEIKEPIYKVSVLGGAPFADKLSGIRRIAGSSEWSEYVCAGTNKGTALSYLQLKLSVSAFDTAVLGNGENDIPMLKNAKLGASLPDANQSYAALARDRFNSPADFFEFVSS